MKKNSNIFQEDIKVPEIVCQNSDGGQKCYDKK